MIPALVKLQGAPYLVLPPGIHEASVAEVEQRFAFNDHRRRLFQGFVAILQVLRTSGCTRVYLDGSFVSDKPAPKDYDGCWDPTGVDIAKLDPVLLDFDNLRAAQKQKYLGEMFIASVSELSGKTFLDFFQTEKSSGVAKGIILIKPQIRRVAP